MIERVGGAAIRAYAAHRRRALEGVARDAVRVQEATLLHLVRSARATEFGRSHGFDDIHSVADYQARTPLGDYLRFMPLWSRALEGERDVTWPGRVNYWVKTSGTTAGDKLIPGVTWTGLVMLWMAALLTLWTGYDYLTAAIRTAMEH